MTLWESSDNLTLGKSSGFVKKRRRTLRPTDAEFEADFFFDHRLSEKDFRIRRLTRCNCHPSVGRQSKT